MQLRPPWAHLSSTCLCFFLPPSLPPPFSTFFLVIAESKEKMAEVLGTVASALAVAEVGIKVGSTIHKLRALWDEIQEVPEEIHQSLREIEILDLLLSDIEYDLAAQRSTLNPLLYNDAAAKLSTSYCREALKGLWDLIDELNLEIDSKRKRRRGMARLKVVLKKETLAKLQARLQRAVQLLLLAERAYST